jgi:hypothetical protein
MAIVSKLAVGKEGASMPRRISRLIGKCREERTVVLSSTALQLSYCYQKCFLVRVARGRFVSRAAGEHALASAEFLMPVLPPTGPSASQALTPHADGGLLAKKCPLLSSYLVDPAWPDGAPRLPSRIFVTPGNGQYEFTLKEPTAGVLLVVMVTEFMEGFTALESLLTSTNPPWRADPWARSVGKKKK